MSRFMVALLGALFVVSVGCQNDKHDGMDHGDKAMNASADACPHCPGVQKATADGKCPLCGAKVKAMSSSSSSAAPASGDVCAHCPGVQTATADGKCPACGAKVAQGQ